MNTVLLVGLLALVVIYSDFRLTKNTFGARVNGIGCIPDVLAGKSVAPAQYRMLVPWICAIFGPGTRSLPYLKPYVYLRWISIVAAIACPYWYFTVIGVDAVLCSILLSIYFIVAALYDYTDVYIEVALFAVAFVLLTNYTVLSCYLLPVIIGVAVLNRETAMVLPLAILLSGHWGVGLISGLVAVVAWFIPRDANDDVERYCSFWMVGENLRCFVLHYKTKPFPYAEETYFLILFAAMVWAYTTALFGDGLSPIQITTGLLFAGLLIPAKWLEIRVFAPCMLILIPMVVA